MDGENNGKPYERMDDLEENPLFSETPIFSEKTNTTVDAVDPFPQPARLHALQRCLPHRIGGRITDTIEESWVWKIGIRK